MIIIYNNLSSYRSYRTNLFLFDYIIFINGFYLYIIIIANEIQL